MMKSSSYTEMDVWETVVQALGMPLEANVAAELQKFYDAAHRALFIFVISMKMMEPLQNHKICFSRRIA